MIGAQAAGTSLPPQAWPSESLGLPIWQWVCFAKKSTLQGSVWSSARLAHKGVSVPSHPSTLRGRTLR